MTATILPACPQCAAKMDFFDKQRNVLTCPQCGTRKAARSWYSDQGATLNVVIARRGPAKQYPIKFIFQCTPEQHKQILERGGAHYLRLLVDKDRDMSYTAI